MSFESFFFFFLVFLFFFSFTRMLLTASICPVSSEAIELHAEFCFLNICHLFPHTKHVGSPGGLRRISDVYCSSRGFDTDRAAEPL